MDFFIRFLKYYWTYIVIAILALLLVCTTGYIFVNNNKETETNYKEIGMAIDDEENVSETLMVDVKGAVKKPGVYAFEKGQIINDAINAAGGFTSKAYNKNINLSKKLSDEMVLYVYTKTEYKNINDKDVKLEECVCPTYEIDSCVTEGNSVIETDSNTNSDILSNIQQEIDKEENIPKKISINLSAKELEER